MTGISTSVPHLPRREQMIQSYNGSTIIVLTGKRGAVGWTLIEKLDHRCFFPDIPIFTKRDATKQCEKASHLKVFKDVTFGDLWERKKSYAMTALEENMLRAWHCSRIVCIGDSANKAGFPTNPQFRVYLYIANIASSADESQYWTGCQPGH